MADAAEPADGLLLEAALDKCDAEVIHQKISRANSELRKSPEIEEKHFTVSMKDPLVTVDPDLLATSPLEVVFVDVPGLNEQGEGTSVMYKNYVQNELFPTLDFVVIVMDVNQGVNSTEQVDLLKFVRDCCEKKKRVKSVVLINKVDEPAGMTEEEETVIREVEAEVETRLGGVNVKCIPMAAENSYVYRVGAGLKLEEFKKSAVCTDERFLDKVGMTEVGKQKWRKLNCVEKVKEVHKIVGDHATATEHLRELKFDQFLVCLEENIGKRTQKALLKQQIEYKMKTITAGDGTSLFAEVLAKKCRLAQGLGAPLDGKDVACKFWCLWEELRSVAISDLEASPRQTQKLHACVAQLRSFLDDETLKALHSGTHPYTFSNFRKWALEKVQDELLMLPRAKLHVIEKRFFAPSGEEQLFTKDEAGIGLTETEAQKAASTSAIEFEATETGGIPFAWQCLSGSDDVKHNVLYSILLVKNAAPIFAERFGSVVRRLEYMTSQLLPWKIRCRGTFDEPRFDDREIEDDMRSEKHWGHLELLCCQLLEELAIAQGDGEPNKKRRRTVGVHGGA
eukprot:g11658.t1